MLKHNACFKLAAKSIFLRFPPWCCAVKICDRLSKAVKNDSCCDFVTEFIYSQTDEDFDLQLTLHVSVKGRAKPLKRNEQARSRCQEQTEESDDG